MPHVHLLTGLHLPDAPRVNVLAKPDRGLIVLLKERCILRRPEVRHQLRG